MDDDEFIKDVHYLIETWLHDHLKVVSDGKTITIGYNRLDRASGKIEFIPIDSTRHVHTDNIRFF